MAELTLRGVKKTYPNGVVAMRGLDLVIADGEFIVVVGPSGCGKSTLLRLVAGLEAVTGGSIAIGGRDVTRLEPAERDIAMVFQNYALYPHMTVYGNMAYGLKNRGMAKPEIDRRVQEAAKILELGAVLERRPRQLSGGQRQRVAMGRAIVREPAVFLFDEPLSNLDAKLRVQMRGEIRRLQRRLGTTSVYVTHDQAEAMTMADRLVVMRDGRAEQVGAPLDVYHRPATRFVAGFIGSPAMNFLPARINGQGRSVVVAGGLRLPLPGDGRADAVGREVVIGVRPEHIVLDGSAAVAEVTVDLVEPLGAETLVHAILADLRLTLRLNGTVGVQPGDRLPVGIAPNWLHMFDAADDTRLELNGEPPTRGVPEISLPSP
jgi:sn-glycerol 3-phosphate transport system ATP-binding protein